jgi:teichuronic acid biosynthesis glycosyltransferase TuaC
MTDLNILSITTLYPNSVQFRHGVFIETRLRKLQKLENVNVSVIAPVPWFPLKTKRLPQYSKFVDVPRYEERHGIAVYHPRYIVIPKVGMLLTPFSLAVAIFRQAKYLINKGDNFDLIDAHYYYPDGVSAALVSRLLKLPLTITARGTDITLIPHYVLPRQMILWAAKVAKYNLAVCEALRQRMVDMGFNAEHSRVFRNGVDLELFRPLQRADLREKWNVNGKLLICAGNLIELKGHHLVIESLENLPGYQLFIVGNGEWETKLRELAVRLGVDDRVRFVGEVKQEQLAELYNCADALVLASSREGWANVLLEAMACGTPVVATNIWGTPEVVRTTDAGVLCSERSVQGIVDGVRRLFDNYPDRKQTRAYAETFSWDETVLGLVKLFSELKST